MKTPIVDFVNAYLKSGISRLHMPGHKGYNMLGFEGLDITEVKGADILCSPKGIIAESESNATEIFGSAQTFYSTEGTSLCIKAMLAIATYGKEPFVLATRNAHESFLYGAALLGIEVEWFYPTYEQHLCSCAVLPKALDSHLASMVKKPTAFYITSPDYLGNVQDISEIAKVCKKYGVMLLVDNAHGSYLKFLKPSCHPIDLGADICCDSAHKTLPVLTGGAYMHISKNADCKYVNIARHFLSMFASTSPSYLVLQSLDLCNKILSYGFSQKIEMVANKVTEIKKILNKKKITTIGNEPLKITVDCNSSGIDGEEVAIILRNNYVEPEFSDKDTVVLMFTSYTDELAFERVQKAFSKLTVGQTKRKSIPTIPIATKITSIREALFCEFERVSVDCALDRVCAISEVTCPPAIPPIFSGELITKDIIKVLKYYGIDKIDVIKKEV